MFNKTKTVVTFAAGAVAGLMLAACLTVQGSGRESDNRFRLVKHPFKPPVTRF